MEATLAKIIDTQKQVTISVIALENQLKELLDDRVGPLFYKELAEALILLEEQGVIEPFKNAGVYSRDPRVKDKYRKKRLSINDEQELKQELLNRFHSKISITYYSKHIDEFRAVRHYIEMISDFLRVEEELENLTVNERSYKLFADEKFLGAQAGKRLLTRLKISYKDLFCHETFEPFFHIGLAQNENENILIVENLDTFNSMKKLFLQNIRSWKKVDFSMIIYGEGNKITKSFYYLDELNVPENTNIYYFGDFDREGISIYHRITKLNNRSVRILPLFYEVMFAGRKDKVTPKKQILNKSAIKYFFKTNSFEDEVAMKEYLISNKYVPQEAVNIGLLRRIADGAEQTI